MALIWGLLGRSRLPLAMACLALAALIGWSAHERGLGAAGERRAEGRRLARAQQQIAAREAKASTLATAARAGLADAQGRILTRTRTLIQKVPVYVPAPADARCTVDRGFVLLHDAAASGGPASLPAAAGGPLDAASGVPLSGVLATVVGNYGIAYDWRAEALSWRAWYVREKAAWEAGP